MKKILMLGGLRYLIPVIKSAHELGYYVITCDYLPNNIGHQYSDEYRNVSITDKEVILNLARGLKVDGVMSFAVDPGVETAAYVCERLGLPSCGPYKSICILQNKALFRKFLSENGFNVPKAKGYENINEALKDSEYFKFPVIVKPVDSAGSKGVSKVETLESLERAIINALDFSISKRFIVEEFIEKVGYSSDSDCFSINGDLVYFTLSNQRFDNKAANPFTPSGYSWPSSISSTHQVELKNEVQRLLRLLNMKTSIYNIEARVGKDNKAYIMEVSPRGGGNRLAEMLRYATGVDLITNSVKAAVGENINNISPSDYNGNWAEYILHSDKKGIFQRLEIDEKIKSEHVVEVDLWIQKGDEVQLFTGANETIGTVVLKFDSKEQLITLMNNIKNWINVIVE